MGRTTIRSLGLGCCILLACAPLVAPFSSTPAIAQESADSGTSTTANTPLSADTFKSNPSSLFSNPSALGSNVTSLIQQGVDPNFISQALNAAGSNVSTGNWNSVLQAVASGNINASTASGVINGVFGNQIPPEIGQAMALAQGLSSNPTQAVMNLLAQSGVAQKLASMTVAAAGQAVQGILNSVFGGAGGQELSSQDVQGLAKSISDAAPQVAQALGGQQGVAQAVASSVGAPGAGTGGIGSATGATGAGGAGGTGSGSTVGTATADADVPTVTPQPCCITCAIQIPQHHVKLKSEITSDETKIRNEITSEFEKQMAWLMTTFWTDNMLKALMLMAEQLTTTGMLQVQMFGELLDAKHQLETQRLFQQLTAKAHKDYQPSEGMCTIGTGVRSLAGSERKSNIAQTAFASRMMQRQTLNGEALSTEGAVSDIKSRLKNYLSTYCDQADNRNGLGKLCPTAVPDPQRRNIDIDFTRNIESRLTLKADFIRDNATEPTADEKDVFALSANLFAHNIPYTPDDLAVPDKRIQQTAVDHYMDMRAIYAKRSVAQNSFAALAAMRAEGAPESAPYTKAVIRELGVSDPTEIEKLLGENPSYFAQMEVLTKKLYQNPVFYTELYDKPVNIERKSAALQAIGLMQDRDLYNSLLRSEAVLSVLLETMLQREQEKVINAQGGNDLQGSQAGDTTTP